MTRPARNRPVSGPKQVFCFGGPLDRAIVEVDADVVEFERDRYRYTITEHWSGAGLVNIAASAASPTQLSPLLLRRLAALLHRPS